MAAKVRGHTVKRFFFFCIERSRYAFTICPARDFSSMAIKVMCIVSSRSGVFS